MFHINNIIGHTGFHLLCQLCSCCGRELSLPSLNVLLVVHPSWSAMIKGTIPNSEHQIAVVESKHVTGFDATPCPPKKHVPWIAAILHSCFQCPLNIPGMSTSEMCQSRWRTRTQRLALSLAHSLVHWWSVSVSEATISAQCASRWCYERGRIIFAPMRTVPDFP